MEQNKREYKGESLIKFPENYVVLDIETTGFSCSHDEIIEIGAIKVRDNEIIDQFNHLLKINGSIPEHIVRLTGISNEMIFENGKNTDYVISEFKSFIGDEILVGHNVNFDINFLYDYFLKYLNTPLTNNFVDTQRVAKRLVKDVYNYRLKTLCRKFDIINNQEHRALSDVYATNELLNKLKFVNEHFVEVRIKQLEPYLKEDDEFKNKKISFKTNLKYIDESISEILKRMNSKAYFALMPYADILVVNDSTFNQLQTPLDEEDYYILVFNNWMYKAQNRIKNGSIKLISESEFCTRLGIINLSEEMLFRPKDATNPLFGKVCVFTGTLDRMNRKQAETIVENIGGEIGKSVTKKTNYLILGNNDYNAAIKNGKSTKHKKAEELQAKGQEIEIIPEDYFYDLIGEE